MGSNGVSEVKSRIFAIRAKISKVLKYQFYPKKQRPLLKVSGGKTYPKSDFLREGEGDFLVRNGSSERYRKFRTNHSFRPKFSSKLGKDSIQKSVRFEPKNSVRNRTLFVQSPNIRTICRNHDVFCTKPRI